MLDRSFSHKNTLFFIIHLSYLQKSSKNDTKSTDFRQKRQKSIKKTWRIKEKSLSLHPEQWTQVHYWDWGVPDRKSCQVRGDSFLLWSVRIDLKPHQFAILIEDVGFQNVVGQVYSLRIQHMAGQRIGYQVGNLQACNVL